MSRYEISAVSDNYTNESKGNDKPESSDDDVDDENSDDEEVHTKCRFRSYFTRQASN